MGEKGVRAAFRHRPTAVVRTGYLFPILAENVEDGFFRKESGRRDRRRKIIGRWSYDLAPGYRPAGLKYFKSGGDWPLRVGIR